MMWLLTTATLVDTSTAIGLTPDSAADALGKALAIGANLPGVMGAVFVAVIMLAYAVIVISKAITTISDYFKAEAKRREEAYLKSLKLEQAEAAFVERMQASASKNMLQSMDAMMKHDYDYYVARMTAGQFDFFDKIPEQFWQSIRLFIDRTDLTPEDKAARIMLIVRRKV